MTGSIQEEVVGIESIVPEKLKRGAVKLVTAAFGDQVDDRALRLAEFRAETITLDTKLLNRID